jgi:hypothetical protein
LNAGVAMPSCCLVGEHWAFSIWVCQQ